MAIGASAGGVRALQTFFETIPADTNAAFVVVVHLDPQHRSELASILGACTRMPVGQVDKPQKLQANRVYLIPPDRRLHLSDNDISASEFDEPRGHRAPIDLFFRSMAEEHGDGFAVVLTGAGADGALGVRAVKESGGIVLVQDPAEAEHASMPRAAIATGVADVVLPLRELAGRLAELIRSRQSAAEADEQPFDDEALRRILAHLRVRTGHDFARYKRSTVLRRIARRMQVMRAADANDYYEALRDSNDEAQALLGDLLISVTNFFRDAAAFDILKSQVLPLLFEGKRAGDAIRVWVPGCATGEEAYSLAILLLEEAARRDIRPTLQVFGSDLDGRALITAREGRYPAAVEADLSEDRLRRFFTREGDHYRVRRELRDIVLFAVHSILKDPPFSRIDLVSCRNLLIYLDRELQQQACSTFHYALNPGGFLFLGSSETAESPPELFRLFDRKARIYQTTSPAGAKPRLVPRLLGSLGVRETMPLVAGHPTHGAATNEAARHRAAIEKVAPPSLLVSQDHRVIHLSDNAGRYLQPSGGPLSGDVIDLVRPELRFEMRSALNRAFERAEPTLSVPILVRFNGAPHRVHFQVLPATDDEGETPRHAVVLFLEGEAVDPSETASPDGLSAGDEIVTRLRAELQLTHARLRTTREESETANEELRAANEELQSINEEYRSTSEELETSKEELQSINEELQTVNHELKLKLDAVSRAHSDLQNLMAATEIGTLFLDSTLRIKRFTDPVTAIFRITPSDEGRPITDFAHLLEYDELVSDARAVLTNLASIRHEVRSRDDHWYDLRLRPYRTVDDRIDGVVVTFVDVSERRKAEDALRERDHLLRQEKRLVELSRDPIFIWEYDGTIVEWNRGSEELYGYSRDEAIGQRKDKLLATIVPGASFDALRAKLLEDGLWNGEVWHRTKGGRQLIIETRIVLDTSGPRKLALESTRDVTERRRWEQEQKLLLSELSHRVKNTLSVVQAIANQTVRTGGSQDFVERFNGRIAALARAHNLLSQTSWRGTDFGELARGQLGPFATDDPARLHIDGPAITLPADQATAFGLVMHELATNAVKHGALSRPVGTVDFSWTIAKGNPERILKVVWMEQGGPAPKAKAPNGFGSTLIERGIPGAKVNRDLRPSGLVCTIEVPLNEAVENVAAERAGEVARPPSSGGRG